MKIETTLTISDLNDEQRNCLINLLRTVNKDILDMDDFTFFNECLPAVAELLFCVHARLSSVESLPPGINRKIVRTISTDAGDIARKMNQLGLWD